MKYNKIALIGMSGCGKTTVSKILSEKLNFKLYDTDEIFEDKFYNISEFFKIEGEKKFRIEEENILNNIKKYDNCIISTGGGIILSEKNRNILFNEDIFTIFLKASAEELYKRTNNDNTRPLLLDQTNKLDKIISMLNDREKYYTLADTIIETSDKTVDKVVNEIIETVL